MPYVAVLNILKRMSVHINEDPKHNNGDSLYFLSFKRLTKIYIKNKRLSSITPEAFSELTGLLNYYSKLVIDNNQPKALN